MLESIFNNKVTVSLSYLITIYQNIEFVLIFFDNTNLKRSSPINQNKLINHF